MTPLTDDAGICAVLNFAPTLRINLESLSFYLKNVEDGTCGS